MEIIFSNFNSFKKFQVVQYKRNKFPGLFYYLTFDFETGLDPTERRV